MSKHATLIKPPKSLPHHSPIENVLSLLPLIDIGPDIYTNARPLWHPPGARGIFGGAAIAQCLSAAQATIPPDFTVHSMHCYFVLAGNSEIPILYHVERVRDGRSFITRTVQARQRGKCIFTTTLSFMREGSGGKAKVEHAVPMPKDVTPPPDTDSSRAAWKAGESGDDRPFESVRCPVSSRGLPSDRKFRHWIRACGRISDCPPSVAEGELKQGQRAHQPGDNHQAHLSAIAYMSDSYFIGTVARVHNLQRFANRRNIERTLRNFRGSEEERGQMQKYLEDIAREEAEENKQFGATPEKDDRRIGMMVSLDHAIFFHNPRSFRADEWMLTEMDSPWAGDGRGLVTQRIWSKSGTLIATCVQEGAVRLAQNESKL
ncbi:acyl-CoA thioesterase II [Rhinocladiella mackenziei CBS 650.93]|uniref:Rhinocladiella mackenziei CBS 650.93 unplaced genomic scaffold supercont1.2, whole genome shotgun sequence n=1 Tax=Rhinocladiella mackenziei CBS 650.93 TaxID=1442369 RepID=A0A0D2FYD1_9EURO|nr:acyl-CoA thioesterase II [Rhinocladiella mackenziei CBS 650.93]KIX07322.1 acyl-CoA thioesterase II [Rhinocladiella mackenziei CBS 650.93]